MHASDIYNICNASVDCLRIFEICSLWDANCFLKAMVFTIYDVNCRLNIIFVSWPRKFAD